MAVQKLKMSLHLQMNRASYSKGFSGITRKNCGLQLSSSQGEYFTGRIMCMFLSARRGAMGLADKVVPGLGSNTFIARCDLSLPLVRPGSRSSVHQVT